MIYSINILYLYYRLTIAIGKSVYYQNENVTINVGKQLIVSMHLGKTIAKLITTHSDYRQ